MKFVVKLFGVGTLAASLGSCGTIDGINDNGMHVPPVSSGSVSDYPVKIGKPYTVRGKTYTPQDVARYDEVGYMSWYGDELAGNRTANGERFNPDGISAAHKTLPLPSYVEVTALDTGRTILVRVNDRGPFSDNRLIDLSHGAAKQLGVVRQGVAAVRVRLVNPSEQERAVLRSGSAVAERERAPDSLLSTLRRNLANREVSQTQTRQTSVLAGERSVRSENSSPVNGYVVQVAAFANKNSAETMARQISAKTVPDNNRKIWRVRYGPYVSEIDAKAGLAQAVKRGYSEARLLRAGT